MELRRAPFLWGRNGGVGWSGGLGLTGWPGAGRSSSESKLDDVSGALPGLVGRLVSPESKLAAFPMRFRGLLAGGNHRKTSQATNPVRPEAVRAGGSHRKASSWHFRCSFQPLLGHSVIGIEQKACVDDVIPEYRAKRASETCFFVILLTSKPCLRQKRHREFTNLLILLPGQP